MNENNRKEDRRTLYTRMVIGDALLELMAEKDYTQLTVADVCRGAMISRSTFYRHYGNLRQVIDDLYADVRKAIENPSYVSGKKGGYAQRHMCLYLRQNRKYLPLFMSPYFRNEAVCLFINNGLREWLGSEGRSLGDDELRSIMFFQLNGCLALVQKHLDASDEEWERIKNNIDAFLARGMADPCRSQ